MLGRAIMMVPSSRLVPAGAPGKQRVVSVLIATSASWYEYVRRLYVVTVRCLIACFLAYLNPSLESCLCGRFEPAVVRV